jgi:phenylalanyl-tRNA synthetase alpha chain
LHLVSQTWELLEDVFVGSAFAWPRVPEIETDWHNFEALNMPPGHPARGMWDTLYVEWGPPGQHAAAYAHLAGAGARHARTEAAHLHRAPGRVFRRDTADATHMPVFHQIEGLVIDKGITFGDLAGTIQAFTRAYFGGDFDSRLRPSYFPFTEPSAEFDIQRPDGSWLELGGCGMVPSQRLALVQHRSRRMVGLRVRIRHRSPGVDALWRRRSPRVLHQ